MTSFSQNLEDSLQRSIDYAAQNNHEHVTVEHLLFSLVDDKEAYKVLKACDVDIVVLRNNIDTFILNDLKNLTKIYKLILEEYFK